MGLQTEIAEWLEEYTPKHNTTDSGWVIIPEVAKERYKQDAKELLAKLREVVEGARLTNEEIDAKFENDWDGLDRLGLVGFVQEDIIQAILKAMEVKDGITD